MGPYLRAMGAMGHGQGCHHIRLYEREGCHGLSKAPKEERVYDYEGWPQGPWAPLGGEYTLERLAGG